MSDDPILQGYGREGILERPRHQGKRHEDQERLETAGRVLGRASGKRTLLGTWNSRIQCQVAEGTIFHQLERRLPEHTSDDPQHSI